MEERLGVGGTKQKVVVNETEDGWGVAKAMKVYVEETEGWRERRPA